MAALPNIPFEIAVQAKTLAADITHGGTCPKFGMLEPFVDDLFTEAGLGDPAKWNPDHYALIRADVVRTVLAHCPDYSVAVILPGPPTVFVTPAPIWWGLALTLGGLYYHKKDPGIGTTAIVAGSALMVWGGWRVGMAA